MALEVSVEVAVALPGGEAYIAKVGIYDLVYNPAEEDMDAEAALCVAAAESLSAEAIEKVRRRLDDWLPGIKAAMAAEE